MLPNIVLDGRLVADPILKFTPSGKAVCSLRVAASDSKKNDDGSWDTLEQIFVNVSLWEKEGEAAAETLSQGDQVLVSGRIYEREYEKSDGTKGRSLEVKFPTVAKKVTAPKGDRTTGARSENGSWGAPAPAANDPWASVGAGNDNPPF